MNKLPIADFTYHLPDDRIANYPLAQRDQSKLLHYQRGRISHRTFAELPDLLPAGSTLFFNDTKVIPARILFHKETGAGIELFLLNPLSPSLLQLAMQTTDATTWKCAIGNLKRWNDGLVLKKKSGEGELVAELMSREEQLVRFSWTPSTTSFAEIIRESGAIPLPPYIKREAEVADRDRYQTVYSHYEGAVAAPTAGLHFTNEVLDKVKQKGIVTDFVTLHVSAGTFQPVKTDDALQHTMHSEQIIISRQNIENLLSTKKVIAVGTTSMRTLESLYWFGVKLLLDPNTSFVIQQDEPYKKYSSYPTAEESLTAVVHHMKEHGVDQVTGHTSIFILPGYTFRICKGLITNFHQPGSTLMLLVAAFVGEDWKRIYNEALENQYRFLSYGDSSLLMP
ncbi:MAG: S-adenosylmethionine tRNA ribosyltransferase [Cytophaga sp.]|nr:S-adenosylmethionine tRNA ribosyltransferase [Cytophaga sp.]